MFNKDFWATEQFTSLIFFSPKNKILSLSLVQERLQLKKYYLNKVIFWTFVGVVAH